MTSPVGYQSQSNYLPALPVSDDASTQINQVSTAIFITTAKQSRSGSPLKISPTGSPLKEHEEHLIIKAKAYEETSRQLEEELQAIDKFLANLPSDSRETFEKERINNLTTSDLQVELADVNQQIQGLRLSRDAVSADLRYFTGYIPKHSEEVLTAARVALEALKKINNSEVLNTMESLLATLDTTAISPTHHLQINKASLEKRMTALETNLNELERRKQLLLARQGDLSLRQDLPAISVLDPEIMIPLAHKSSNRVLSILFASESEKSEMLERMSQELIELESLIDAKRQRLANLQATKYVSDEGKADYESTKLIWEDDIKRCQDKVAQFQNYISILKAAAEPPHHLLA